MVGQDREPTVPVEGGPESVPSPPQVLPASGVAPKDGLQYFGPSPRWQLLNLRELWRYRELLWMLAQRDLKVRYRQAIVGVVWVVLQPLSTALVFVVLFGLLGHTPAGGGVPYGVFVLPGVVLWQLFAGTITQATASLVTNQHLIGKVFFPRLVLPVATALANLVDFIVGLVVILCVLAAYGIAPPWTIVFLPAFVLLGLTAALAVGIWTAALNAMYRDTGLLIPFLLQVGFFLSPVIYAGDVLIPERWRAFLLLNPMVGAVNGFRWSLLGGDPPIVAVAVSVAVTGLVLITGLTYFRRIESVLTDRI